MGRGKKEEKAVKCLNKYLRCCRGLKNKQRRHIYDIKTSVLRRRWRKKRERL